MNAQQVADAPAIAPMTLDMPSDDHLPAVPQQRSLSAPVHVDSHDPIVQLMAAAVQRGAGIEELREMVQLAREMREDKVREEKRHQELAFRRAMAAFRGENIIIPKTKHVDRGRGGSFEQAEWDVVCRLLSPALSKHGFSFAHDPRFTSRKWTDDKGVEQDIPWVVVICTLDHEAGYSKSIELEGPPSDNTANTPAQNMQCTATFLKRQTLLAITGTATGGEDDEARMRNREHGGQVDSGETDVSEEDRLQREGITAADEGMDALTRWWGSLSNKQRTLMNPHFGGMRKRAEGAR
jgi:hypothetical protein